MPGKIKVKVLAGRNLPVMDRASDTTDAFVEIKFGGVTHKTDVCRKSLNPHWNSTEWYRFEVDESELQDEPLQLRLMDHDTYSANDAIGKVVISLAPLLAREANNIKGITTPPTGALMSGWIPVFDTMHGIRGELNVIVKVELFSDFNKYKTSSCGVQFFHCPMIPPGYKVTTIHGFVEELVVNDDPEYQWIDKIRTPRASNEARQVAFIKLSNQVQRLVGVKAAELGANAVVGYQQDFDLEGEAGVVARAIGTAVSITPLPLPFQPLSIPACTQQQLKKYLDILATDTESITDLNQYFQNHQDELHKLLNILNPKTPALLDEPDNGDDDEKSMDLTRQSSIKSYAGSISIYQDDYVSQKSLKHISEDQTDLNKLLKRNEDSDSDSAGPLQKIKKIKTNFFKKRFSGIRSRNPDKQDDQISLKSNSSDTSRISLTDIRNEFKKFKRLKKPKFRKGFVNKEDEGIGMASILARSVIHAHTSLACIAETQDSEHSPNSTMRRTSESEPTINMSDEDKTKNITAETSSNIKMKSSDTKRKVPEIHTSLKDINSLEDTTQTRSRKLSESCPATPVACRSENLLKLPGEAGYFGSLSLSGDSSEIYTSSDDDDESSDQKTDTEKSVETTSSVVQSVLKHDVNPAFIAQMDRKLSILEGISPDPNEIKYQTDIDNYGHGESQDCYFQSLESSNIEKYNKAEKQDRDFLSSESSYSSQEAKSSNVSDEKCDFKADTSVKKKTDAVAVTKSDSNYHFKFHNPFSHKKASKSISAPSSPVENTGFVYRSSKKIKRQLSKISKNNMIKSLSHYSLLPKKKHSETKVTLSQPGSSSDVPSKVPSHETVLGSPFLSYADLLTLGKDASDTLKPHHKSDEFDHSKVTMYIGSEPVSRASLSGPSLSIHKDDASLYEPKSRKPSLKPTGLVHTAMETILIDKVQSLLVPTSPEPSQTKEKIFFDHVNEKLEKVEEARNYKEGHQYEQSKLREKTTSKDKNDSLVHTAIETILMDKVQSLLMPTTPTKDHMKENIFFSDDSEKYEKIKKTNTCNETKANDKDNTQYNVKNLTPTNQKEEDSLVGTAMKTILIDKVQSLVPISSKTINFEKKYTPKDIKRYPKKPVVTENTNRGLLHTAMETILMEKVHSLLPPTLEPIHATNEHDIANDCKNTETKGEDENLVHTAVETILIDKVQSLLIPTSHVFETENKNEEIKSRNQFELKVDPSTSKDKQEKKLVRQDSIHSITEPDTESRKMSKEIDANIVIPCKVTQNKPFLQHFHPIRSGAHLETIPSLPEGSFDHSESLDIEGVQRSCDCKSECDSDTNTASVCDNSHAACRFDRTERAERERENSDKDKGSPRHARHESYGGREPVTTTQQSLTSSLNSSSIPVCIHRRSSDSDLSVTPKASSLNASLGNAGSGGGAILRPSMNTNNLDMLEYPFLTMTECPPRFIVHLGGTVCARSVKLVDAGGESAARAAWWAELRTELRAHARALRCNAVIAYSESAAICEDVCVLSASGTAAVINLDCEFSLDTEETSEPKVAVEETENDCCFLAHVPYSPGTGPYRAELSTCGGCRKARVPAVLLATCAKPNKLKSCARAVTLTAVAARVRRAPPAAEPGARDISDQLPFLEYELHKLLLAKLRMQGANALFSLHTQIAIGERCVIAFASGTAVRLISLPPPTPPRIKASENDKDALDIQKTLWEAFTANKTANGFDIAVSNVTEQMSNIALPDVDIEEPPVLDLCSDKDACVLELDEAEDVETAKALGVRRMHMQVFSNGLKAATTSPPHAFAQVWRARLVLSGQGSGASTAAERHVTRALEGVTYKLRRLQPCALVTPRFQLELPDDEIQLVVSGSAIRLVDPNKSEFDDTTESDLSRSLSQNDSISNIIDLSQESGTGDADDDIFELDEEQLPKQTTPSETADEKNLISINGQTPTAVSLTSLSFVSGSRAARRICALRLLFVRETTAVRELGGLSGFLHTFTCEVLAIVRAYTAALGGNALTSFYIRQLMLQDNAHKNQGQCLLSVGGDVVQVTF